MMPCGLASLIAASGRLYGQISQYTLSSRMRRAISWVYWLPKSRIRTPCSIISKPQLRHSALERFLHEAALFERALDRHQHVVAHGAGLGRVGHPEDEIELDVGVGEVRHRTGDVTHHRPADGGALGDARRTLEIVALEGER